MLNCIKFFVLTSTFLFVSFGFGQTFTVDFDDDAKWNIVGAGYQTNNEYNDQGWIFTGGPALRNTTTAQDGFPGALGIYSWRLQNATGVSWTATFNGTAVISAFGFDVRRWDNNPDPDFTVEYSVNAGGTWTTVATVSNAFLGGSSDWLTFSQSITSVSVSPGDFIVRISRNSGERIMIDNFSWTEMTPTNPEPTNHPTNFGCTSVSSSEINLTWIDAIGAQLPDGYLIKWSDVSYAAITDPTDGSTANGANSVTVNNGVENVTITGLTPSTQYFFKIYPYTNSGAAIDYKIDGVIELTDCTTDTGPCVEESFTNNTAPGGTYSAGSYTGDSGSTWEYSQARSVTSGDNITGTSLGFSDNGTGYVSSVSSGGVGNITFSIRSYFTGGTAADRTIEVWVAGIFQGSFTLTSMGVIETHTISNINVSGAVLVEFRSVGSRQIVLDDVSWTCYSTSSNTITTSTVSSATFNVDCSTGEAGTVGFTSSGEYNGGNLFTAELSDATGSFASPTSIGTLAASGTDPSGTINIAIPAGTASGTGYRIRVVSSDHVVTGSDNGTDITVSLSGGPCIVEPPHMTSVIINSCNTTCSEGQNEVIFGNTGDYYVLMNSANFELTYGTSPSPTDIYSDPLVSNPSKTSELNSSVGCPGLFVDGTGITLPPNSKYMLALDEICPGDVLDFSNLCGSGPIYVIYTTTASSWIAGGNFVNSSSCSGGVRYFTTAITSTDGTTHVIDYSFDCTLNSGSDGDYATWNYLGGSAILQGNNGCTLDPIVLPITLVDFDGFYNGYSVDLNWMTLSEQNNDYFALYHSTNGKIFEQIGQVSGNGNTTTLLNYSFEHRAPRHGMNYYKLKSIDFDGSEHDNGTVAVLVELNEVFYNQTTMSIQMNYESDYSVYGSDGRLVKRVTNQNTLPFTGKGIYHVIDERSGKSFKLGIW